MGRCIACECSKTSKQVVFGEGNPKARLVSIGEGPGPTEDETGRPFDGKAGKLYDAFLDEVGINRKDIWTDNAVKCFPGREKGAITHPSDESLNICYEKWLLPQLTIMKPRVILAWGLSAAKVLLPELGNLTMGEICGKEFETLHGFVIPLYHPSYFLRNPTDFLNKQKVLEALQRAIVLAGLGAEGGNVEQTKMEHHQEDKGVISELESKSGVFDVTPWHPEREYSTAWSDEQNIVLIYKQNGFKRVEVIDDFEWYFYLKTDDVLDKIPGSFWSFWMKEGLVKKLRADPKNPAWTMVFAERYVIRTQALREHLLESYLTLWNDNLQGKYKHDERLRMMLDELDEKYKVMHYEADLTPLRRFMTDYDIKILGAYDEMYVDIETDDTKPLGDPRTIGERRILSIAWETYWADKTKKVEKGFLLLKGENDRAERELCNEFARVMEKIDIAYAWNGNQFDFPVLRHRMRRYEIRAPWETIHTIDLLRTWLRYFQRGASVNTSYSLQAICQHVLKESKIDWKLMAKERGLKLNTYLELYRQAPDILEIYNRDDCAKMGRLEAFTGFAKIDQVFSRIGNCFAKDYHITTKIDSLLLKRGKQTGYHFKTKKVKILSEGGKAAYRKELYHGEKVYEGAFVLDPILGLHENVAAVDFKSLYPSVMVAWNISPETILTEKQVLEMDPRDYVTCPTGSVFRTDRKGFVPEIFADTLEKRKVYTKLQQGEEVGSDLFLLYYRLAYSFKRLGLSFYGDMGNVESRYFHPKVAEAVTLSGQYILKEAIAYAEREGITPLYGDTDSLYLKMPQSMGLAFVDKFNVYIKTKLAEEFRIPPERFVMELEYENYFRRMFFVKKKRYAGVMTMYKGKDAKNFIEIKGLECMRSDGIEYARVMQRTIITMVVRDRIKPATIIDFLLAEREKTLTHKLLLEDITITKGVMKPIQQYKSNLIHVRIADEIRASGGEYYVGMKVPFVIIESSPKLVGIHAEKYQGTYDERHYWDKQIFPPSFRILHACYPKISWQRLFVAEKLKKDPKPALHPRGESE